MRDFLLILRPRPDNGVHRMCFSSKGHTKARLCSAAAEENKSKREIFYLLLSFVCVAIVVVVSLFRISYLF